MSSNPNLGYSGAVNLTGFRTPGTYNQRDPYREGMRTAQRLGGSAKGREDRLAAVFARMHHAPARLEITAEQLTRDAAANGLDLRSQVLFDGLATLRTRGMRSVLIGEVRVVEEEAGR